MKYGCIGERLGHSFSREIHNAIADYEYEIREIERDNLSAFIEKKDFLAINVTIPYKELVMPHLYFTDGAAKSIGAVNTVVNRDGKLYGYNTDFYGMKKLIEHAKINVSGKKAVILGTGGTSKTACAVMKSLGARQILRVSREKKEGVITYGELYEEHSDAEIIINTTPVGTFPNITDTPLILKNFKQLSGVVDAVYNPLRTALVLEALKMGVPAESGLYMLVAQAVRASEIFLNTEYPKTTLDSVYEKSLRDKENVVLIGMPSSGKSTVGAILADRLQRELVDTDQLIVEREKKSIPDIFRDSGEAYFRRIEAEAVREVSRRTGIVIATGGGVPLSSDNVSALKQNGKLFFLDRAPSQLTPTKDRPLLQNAADVEKRYRERYGIYTGAADFKIDVRCDAVGVAEKIERIFTK